MVKSEQRGFVSVCMCVRRLFTLKGKVRQKRAAGTSRRGGCLSLACCRFAGGMHFLLFLDNIATFEAERLAAA